MVSDIIEGNQSGSLTPSKWKKAPPLTGQGITLNYTDRSMTYQMKVVIRMKLSVTRKALETAYAIQDIGGRF